jgi:hypothetical protein
VRRKKNHLHTQRGFFNAKAKQNMICIFVLLFVVVGRSLQLQTSPWDNELVAVTRGCESLTGTWVNELGSVANLHAHAKTGELVGDYTTAVGIADGTYLLRGSYQVDSCDPTFAFVVTWQNAALRSNSTTAWSGVFVNGTLYTTWLLAEQVATAGDVWRATRIGTNVFFRTK